MDQESLAPKPVLALAPAAHDAPPLSVQSDGAWTLATGPPSTPSADALSQLSELREAARLANSRLREALRSTYGMVPSEAGEEAPPGGGRLELWLLDAAKVGAEAAATAARLCPGLRVGLPREPQWPHEGDCTAECSLQCSARIDWAELGQ